MSDFTNDSISNVNKLSSALSGAERPEIEAKLKSYQQHLQELPATATDLDRANIQLDIAEALLTLDRKEEAWKEARALFDVFLKHEDWQRAVETCNVLYQTEQPASISALGQGVWLSVTYPIDPETSVAMLNHIVDETPTDSDGAAVAAMAAYYIADIRSNEDKHESTTFLARNILAQVAKRHSNVSSQDELNAWIERLELNDPQVFLPRLSLIVNAIVGETWWFDRDELRARLPVN